MNRRREPKKSESLEIRLPHEVKNALMRKARTEGRSASEVVRQSIAAYLAEKPKEAHSMFTTLGKPAAALGAAAIAIWTALTPSAVHAKPDLKAVFQAVDRNADGAITAAEFLEHPSNPELRKVHDAHRGGIHQHMAAMHGQGSQVDHKTPSDEMLRSHFARLDADSNGTASFAEFRAFHDEMKASHEGN